MPNFINILMFITPTIIYYATTKTVSSNYRLRRDFKVKDITTKTLPVDVIRKIEDIDETKILQHNFSPLVNEFVEIIKENIPSSDLTLFFYNFNDLKITKADFKLSNLIFNESVGGMYVPKYNTIKLDNDFEQTIDHELFHASTTFFDSDNNTVFSGFQQIKDWKYQIGEGLNEGYTQYLTEKYFGNKHSIFNAYPYEKRIAEMVEIIVGKEKMQSLYFNANLRGLVECLKQYNSEENIYDFITTLDFLNKHLEDKYLTPSSNEIRINSLKRINAFLVQTHIRQIILEYPNEKWDKEKMWNKIFPLVEKIPNLQVNGKNFIIIDEQSIIDIIDENLYNSDLNVDKKPKI